MKLAKIEALTIRNLEKLDSGASEAISLNGTISCNDQEDIKNYIDSLPSKYGNDKFILFDFLANSGSYCRVIGYTYPSGSYAAYILIFHFNFYLCMKRNGEWQADKNM